MKTKKAKHIIRNKINELRNGKRLLYPIANWLQHRHVNRDSRNYVFY